MENYSTTSDTNLKNKSWWYPLIILACSTFIIALIAYFVCKMKAFNINSAEISFALKTSTLTIISIFALIIAIIATYLMWHKAIDKKPQYVRLNLILYYIGIALICLAPILFFNCKSSLFASIALFLAILLFIYLTYRYYSVCLVSGGLITAFVLWLLYLFSLSFASFLI